MLALEYSANPSTTAAKQTMEARMTLRNWWSPMCGKKPRTIFSEKATEGASNVADEQLMIADSTAPKKMAWAKTGVCWRTSVGNTSCESVSIRPLNSPGSISVAE